MRALLLVWLLAGLPGVAVGEYFLDGSQRRELLLDGQITGRDGAQYSVWIVPGYTRPLSHVGKGWRAAADDLAEYGKPGYWPDMLKMTRHLMRFARQDILREFAYQGTAEAWRDSSAAASQRVRRRVFGWWFAWPWAAVEASAESVVRVGLGVPGSVVLWTGSGLVTPVVYATWPAGMAAGHAFGQGTLYPVSASAWNTLVAPPLALAGQQPAPERADGWWMKRLADPAEADIRARLSAWKRGWADAPDLRSRRELEQAAEAEHQAHVQALRKELAAAEQSWHTQRLARDTANREALLARALAVLEALRAEMTSLGYTPARLQAIRDSLRDELLEDGADAELVEHILRAWLGREDTLAPDWQQSGKTDPLQQVIQRAPGVLE